MSRETKLPPREDCPHCGAYRIPGISLSHSTEDCLRRQLDQARARIADLEAHIEELTALHVGLLHDVALDSDHAARTLAQENEQARARIAELEAQHSTDDRCLSYISGVLTKMCAIERDRDGDCEFEHDAPQVLDMAEDAYHWLKANLEARTRTDGEGGSE